MQNLYWLFCGINLSLRLLYQTTSHFRPWLPIACSPVVNVISCRLFWLQYRLSKMGDVRDVRDSKSWVHFHLQDTACLFTPSGQSKPLTREEKKNFMAFLFSLLSLTERSGWFAERRNEAETRLTFVSFYPLTANTIYHLPSLDIYPLVKRAKKTRLGWRYNSFKILVLVSCRPCLFSAVYRVDTNIFVNYAAVQK